MSSKSIMQKTAEDIERERLEVEERNMNNERCGMDESICPVCGKTFMPAPYHVYKDNEGRFVCTYSCSLDAPSKSKKKRYIKWRMGG